MLIETMSAPLNKFCSADATETSFASKIPTGTEPTGNGVVSAGGGFSTANRILLIPYATGNDDATFSLRLIGWRVVGTVSTTLLWIPVPLLELACVLSTVVGVSGRLITNAQRFCDTLTLVGSVGNDDVSMEIISPTGNIVAHAISDVKGFQKLEALFDSTEASVTAMNCLYSFI